MYVGSNSVSASRSGATTSRALIRQALCRLSITASPDAKSSDGRRPVKVRATAESQNMTAAGATDFDIATLRARRTNKWHKFPPDVLPAWVADMDFGVAPSITAALTRLTQNQDARDRGHGPSPDRQPDARRRHAVGARPRRVRGGPRSAHTHADILPPAEPHRASLQPGGTTGGGGICDPS